MILVIGTTKMEPLILRNSHIALASAKRTGDALVEASVSLHLAAPLCKVVPAVFCSKWGRAEYK